MALTPSSMLPLGTVLPEFELLDTHKGAAFSSASLSGKLALVGFICNHCPYVLHIVEQLAKICADFQAQDVDVVMISSNSPKSHPQDGPKQMATFAQENGFTFLYCFDESQEVAKAFKAECTPEFYLFDGDRKLMYRGQFDSSRPGQQSPVTGDDLILAVELGLQGKILDPQKPSVGYNIKWAG